MLETDYLDKLNDSEKEWLNKFMGEYVGASFSKNNKANIHKSDEHKKDSYDRNNSRNRCILTKEKATGRVKYLEELTENVTIDIEDSIINRITIERHLNDLDKVQKNRRKKRKS